MWKNKPWLFQVEGGEGGGAASSSADGAGSADAGKGSEGGDEGGFKPITSQKDLNSLISERVNRERSKYSDYADLKAKAAEYDRTVEASKSEAQKAAESQQKLQNELTALQTSLLRRDVAAEHGITDKDDIELFLTGTDKETLIKQAKRLAERTPVRKGNRVSREGTNPQAGGGETEERAAVQGLFGGV